MNNFIDQVFASKGLLAQHLPGYEVRTGQIELARKVATAITDKGKLLAEAPCGSGKGFAYGVPVVYQAHHYKQRAVIATANIALQNQLIEKDLPLLQEALPFKFKAALLKGRGNFLCLRKLGFLTTNRDATLMPGTPDYDNYGMGAELGSMLHAVSAWAMITTTGDRDDPGFPSGTDKAWSIVTIKNDECLGAQCPYAEACWSNKHRKAATEADIVVTNYNLLFAHAMLSMRARPFSILPPFDTLIMDEAHDAAKIARDSFGSSLGYHRFKHLAEALKTDYGSGVNEVEKAGGWLVKAITECVNGQHYRVINRLEAGMVDVDEIVKPLKELLQRFTLEDLDGEGAVPIRILARTTETLIDDLEEIANPLEDKVYWIEKPTEPSSPSRVESRPLEVGPLLKQHVYTLAKTVVMTSATMTTAGTFDLVRDELGADDAVEFVAESPFDFKANAQLVVAAASVPAPVNRQQYNQDTLPLYREILDLWPGRVLCLFTAWPDVDWMHKKLDGYGGRVFHKQGKRGSGSMPRSTLVDWFRADPTSVLMGVDSFWTGIDVPGPKAIILHKLPFPYQDAVLTAIRRRMPDKDWYQKRYYPWMAMRLRQGVGRLIRRSDDYGIVVCMDRRITDHPSYSRYIARSLPFDYYHRTDALHLLQPFLTERGA